MLKRLAYPLALLLLAALVIACWTRSYSHVDIFYYQPYYDQGNTPDVQYHLRADQGLLRFGAQYGNEEAWTGKLGHASRIPGVSPFPFFRWDHTAAYNGIPDVHYSDFTLLGLGFRQYASRSVDPRLHWWDVSLPLWLLTAIPLALAIPPLLRLRRRLSPTACPTCSYDLRAHHPGQKCPECGTPIPARPKPPP